MASQADDTQGSPPPRKFYKGEIESNNYASTVIPNEGKYGGQVYDSTLYHGEIQGPGYSPTSARSLHDGFYMGVELGYDSYKVRDSINVVRRGISIFQQNPELNAVGTAYTVVAGYGRYFDWPLYIGAEFFYNYSLANTSENVGLFNGINGVYYVKSEIQGTYGASFMPGIKLSEGTLFYLKGGYTRLELKTYESSAALHINNAQSNGVNGLHWGLGLEANLYKNWSLRGEYTHLNGENFQTRAGSTMTPSDNQFMLGLLFHLL